MLSVRDVSSDASAVVTNEGLRRMFLPLFDNFLGGLSLAAFGISSVVYFNSSFKDVLASVGDNLASVSYGDVKGSIVGIISEAGGGLTIDAPVLGSDGRMQSTLTCVLGSRFHEDLYSRGVGLFGCGIILGGERNFSSNSQFITSMGVPKGTEVLFAYESFGESLSWSQEEYEGAYVHSFVISLGRSLVE